MCSFCQDRQGEFFIPLLIDQPQDLCRFLIRLRISSALTSTGTIRGISALLESDNTLRLYLGFKNVESSDLTFKIDGDDAELKQRSDGMCYLALDGGVYSNHLHNPHTYSVSDGTSTYTITASVLTYARSCAFKNNETERNLGKALYLYSEAAKEAFK